MGGRHGRGWTVQSIGAFGFLLGPGYGGRGGRGLMIGSATPAIRNAVTSNVFMIHPPFQILSLAPPVETGVMHPHHPRKKPVCKGPLETLFLEAAGAGRWHWNRIPDPLEGFMTKRREEHDPESTMRAGMSTEASGVDAGETMASTGDEGRAFEEIAAGTATGLGIDRGEAIGTGGLASGEDRDEVAEGDYWRQGLEDGNYWEQGLRKAPSTADDQSAERFDLEGKELGWEKGADLDAGKAGLENTMAAAPRARKRRKKKSQEEVVREARFLKGRTAGMVPIQGGLMPEKEKKSTQGRSGRSSSGSSGSNQSSGKGQGSSSSRSSGSGSSSSDSKSSGNSGGRRRESEKDNG